MSFFPAGFKLPSSNQENFMDLEEGENKIRILSQPVMGWEDWQNGRPVRYTVDSKPPKSVDPKKPIKFYMAFIVFNYSLERIQVLKLTQATILKAFEALQNDSDWGELYNYDIKINKSGTGMNTKYNVNPTPHKPVDSYIISQFNEMPCDLSVYIDCGDPFSPYNESVTRLAIANKSEPGSKVEQMPHAEFISLSEVNQLELLISRCDPDVQVNMKKYIETEFTSLHKVPADKFSSLKNSFQKKAEEYSNSNTVPF